MRRRKLVLCSVAAAMLLASVPAFAQIVLNPQVPLPAKSIPQFVQELPRLTLDNTGIKVALGAAVDVSMCEFQTQILPPNTPWAGGVPDPITGIIPPPATWVWGYQHDPACGAPAGSYINPVVVAVRGTPTQMTYWNRLPDANTSNVQAYAGSTDQTLQWADPFSLDRSGLFNAPPPELNDCNLAVKQFHDGTLDAGGNPIQPTLPTPCLDNYGFVFDWAAVPPVFQYSYTAPVPAAPHLHGGEIPAFLDGGPDAWFTPNGIYGHGYYSKGGFDDAAFGKAVYTYPNVQDAAPTWFHDHVLGATRLNVYAGIAGAYYQVDPNLQLPLGMHPLGLMNGPASSDPLLNGVELLVPLVIQDRMFDTNGQLLFPAVGINPEHPFWIPEFVGDTIVVNGKAWPKVTVQPKRYRFLVLNGSNARAYELFLTDQVTNAMGPAIWVIGNDQGYLNAPVKIDPNAAANSKLVVMPGERYEIIIDFGLHANSTLLMRNTARTPYPGGATTSGSTTGRVLQFVVGPPTGVADGGYNPASGVPIRTGASAIQRLTNPATGTLMAGTVVDKRRQLTLNEVIAVGGPIEILMNNTPYTGEEAAAKRALLGINDFVDVPSEWNVTKYSEQPIEGETEVWEIVNLTADAHPIHPHLVAFQILNRQKFDFKGYDAYYNSLFPTGLYEPGFGPPCHYTAGCAAPPVKKPPILPPGQLIGGNPDVTYFLKGPVMPPTPAEQGWKDTAISYPGEVLRLAIRFAPTALPNTTPAAQAHYEFSPSEGHGYVWHCHIIDHEDNEMMRPFNVIENANFPAAGRALVKGIDY